MTFVAAFFFSVAPFQLPGALDFRSFVPILITIEFPSSHSFPLPYYFTSLFLVVQVHFLHSRKREGAFRIEKGLAASGSVVGVR